jgi:HEAT repeat protein
MRPKIVILTLVIAFGVLGAVAVFKGIAQKRADESAMQPATNTAAQTTVPADTNVPVATANPGAANTGAVSEELRAAVVEKELDQIRTLQGEIDGSNNPVIIAALLEKMNNPEAEVRHGVVQALIEINDTNAVPGLQKAADSLQDPREKVAVLDAIAFLKAPDVLDGVTPEQMTNNYTAGSVNPHLKMNPNFMRKVKNQNANPGNGQPIPAPDAPQSQ